MLTKTALRAATVLAVIALPAAAAAETLYETKVTKTRQTLEVTSDHPLVTWDDVQEVIVPSPRVHSRLTGPDVVGRNAPHPVFMRGERVVTRTQKVAVESADEVAATGERVGMEVHFAWDEAELRPDAREKLDAFVAELKKAEIDQVEIGGHADTSGPDAYNDDLSAERAREVAEYLNTQGISTRDMEIQWYGERRPQVETGDGVRLEENRRVELLALR